MPGQGYGTATLSKIPANGKVEEVIGSLHDNLSTLDVSLERLLVRLYHADPEANFAAGSEAGDRIVSIADFAHSGEEWINARFRKFHERLDQIEQVLF